MQSNQALQMHPRAFSTKESAMEAGRQLAGDSGYFEVRRAQLHAKDPGPLGTERYHPVPDYFVHYHR